MPHRSITAWLQHMSPLREAPHIIVRPLRSSYWRIGMIGASPDGSGEFLTVGRLIGSGSDMLATDTCGGATVLRATRTSLVVEWAWAGAGARMGAGATVTQPATPAVVDNAATPSLRQVLTVKLVVLPRSNRPAILYCLAHSEMARIIRYERYDS